MTVAVAINFWVAAGIYSAIKSVPHGLPPPEDIFVGRQGMLGGGHPGVATWDFPARQMPGRLYLTTFIIAPLHLGACA